MSINILKNIGLVFLLLVSTVAYAATDPLSERGIDPGILDAMITSLSQKTAYTGHLDIDVRTEGKIYKDTARVIYEPHTDYGIDLFMQFDKRQSAKLRDRSHYQDMLERRMKLQHRLQKMEFQYDPGSIKLVSAQGNKAVISYSYKKTALPQPIAFLRFMSGKVYLKDNIIQRIELTNEKTFLHDGVSVSSFKVSARLIQVEKGKYLLKKVNSDLVGVSVGFNPFATGEKLQVKLKHYVLEYRDKQGKKIYQAPVKQLSKFDLLSDDDENLETVRVKLDRMFPIWGKEARKLGFDLPQPFGVNLIYNSMNNKMDFTSFDINGNRQLIELLFNPNGSNASIDSKMTGIRADWFVLPFLNLQAIVGKVDTEANLLIRTTDLAAFITPGGLPEYLPLKLDLDVTMAGLGITAAAGFGNYFGSISVFYVDTVTAGANTKSTSYSVTPLFGYQLPDYRMRILIGAEYLSLKEEMVGRIDLPGEQPLSFRIGIKSSEWASRIGIHKEFGSRFEGVWTYSKGEDREGWNINFGYRF